MAETNNEAVPLKHEEAVQQQTNVGAEEVDTHGKTDALGPRKRDRPHVEENDSTGSSAKRVKGVAPIKAE
jgi:tRNA-dihydrouridine synthase 3